MRDWAGARGRAVWGAFWGAVGGACVIDGWVLAGMQGDGAGALIDARVQGACRLGWWWWWCFGMLLGVLFNVLVMARVHFREIDGWLLWGCCLGGRCGCILRD